jgi:hypothetical protein
MTSPHRSAAMHNQVIGLSISYQRDHLLARGLGLEHLRALLIRLALPLLRQGASLAYGGHWKEAEDNFTFDLLRLISAEQQDNTFGGPDTSFQIGRLYNHSAWPNYLDITPRIEAQWIDSCRIIRITQQDAGIAEPDLVQDSEASTQSDRAVFNTAVVLSKMRRLTMQGMPITIPDVPSPELVPPVIARIVLGGRVDDFRGFLPGIFEETLLTLEHQCPLYVLGGFGGAAEALAKAFTAAGPPPEFTVDWQKAHTPNVAKLERLSAQFSLPSGVLTTSDALNSLTQYFPIVQADLAGTLRTGLDQQETRELLSTQDTERAVALVYKGLKIRMNLPTLPA